MLTAKIDASSSGSNEIVAAVAGKRIRVLGYVVIANAAVAITWLSASTSLSGAMNLAGAGYGVSTGQAVTEGFRGFHLQTAVGEALNLNLSGAVAVGGHLVYELVT